VIDKHKTVAREDYGRSLQVWIHGTVICRPTQREADEYYQYVAIEKGDHRGDPTGRKAPPPTLDSPKRIPGWGGHPLVGTPESIVDELVALSQAGISGCLLSWVNNEVEQPQWIDGVLPLMEQAGLRTPFSPANPD